MSYKDILVRIDATAPAARYEVAADLAARSGGGLTGLYLKTTLIAELAKADPAGAPPFADLARRIHDRLQRQDAEVATAAAILSKIALAANVDCECRTVSGDTAHDMIAEARHADLVVVGPPSPADFAGAAPVDILRGGGAPVLIVPEKVEGPRVGRRVLVAWNGSLESSRALRDVLPILTEDAVLEIRMAQSKHDRTNAEALCRHLERRGLRLNLKTIEDEGQSIPEWLIGEAVQARCDLMVMGVYGHTRLHDFVLSDVSGGMLRATPLPLLISR